MLILRKHSAFTLAEILLVTSLFAILSVALFSTFSSAIKVWKKTQKAVLEQDIAVVFDRITEDFHNAFHMESVIFEGNTRQVEIPTVVWMEADPFSTRAQEEWIDQAGRVEYRFDKNARVLWYREANYSQAVGNVYGPERALLRGVDSVEFQYFYQDDTNLKARASVKDVLPAGVEIEVVFSDETGLRRMKHFIHVPVGL